MTFAIVADLRPAPWIYPISLQWTASERTRDGAPDRQRHLDQRRTHVHLKRPARTVASSVHLRLRTTPTITASGETL